MPEPSATTLLEYVWSVLVVPIGWILRRLAVHEKRLTDHEIKDAETYMHKDEVHRTIQDALGPIRMDTREIKQDLKELTKHVIGARHNP